VSAVGTPARFRSSGQAGITCFDCQAVGVGLVVILKRPGAGDLRQPRSPVRIARNPEGMCSRIPMPQGKVTDLLMAAGARLCHEALG